MNRLRNLAVVLLILAGAGYAIRVKLEDLRTPFKGYTGVEQFVDLPHGSSSPEIGTLLVEKGIVRNPLVFRIVLWQSGSARQLKAGEYRFNRPMTPREVIDKLVRGDVLVRALTFPEGLTIREMARTYEAHGFGPAASFAAAATNVSLVADLDATATDLEGYLFPETYALTRHTSAAELVAMMVARFRAVFDPELRRETEARGLSIRQVVTLASMVEKETARADERPHIAGVYLKRLAIKMGLQSDPTVIYALDRAGRYDGNLTRENLAFESPYNTYRHAGLPPGPIAAPGRSAIEAVVRPAATSSLYFVSRNDGSHIFARTLEEHNLNVQRYQVQYFREKRLQGVRTKQTPR